MQSLLIAVLLAFALLPVPPQNQNGSIEGRVVRTGTNSPVIGLSIAIQGPPGGNAVTTSDTNGRFVFRDVPPGMYTLSGESEAYVSPVGPLGMRAPLFTTVRVAPNQRLQLPAIPLPPASTITGRVRDSENRPVANLSVDILRISSTARVRTWEYVSIGLTTTDDRGEYRVARLLPGEYYVRVSTRPLSGLQTSNTGNATVTYFPGTPDPVAAAAISVDGNEVVADIRMPPATPVEVRKISGRILFNIPNVDQLPATTLNLVPRNTGPVEPNPDFFRVANMAAGESGQFEIRGVRSGSYDLVASGRLAAAFYFAKLSLEVRDEDLRGVEIALRPGVDVKGRLVSDGGPPGVTLRAGPLSQILASGGGPSVGGSSGNTPNQFRLELRRKDGFTGLYTLGPLVDATATAFTFPNVPPGDYDLTVSGLPPLANTAGIYVADIRQEARSIQESGFTVGTEDPEPVEILVAKDAGTIEGIVEGKVDSQVTLVVVPSTRRSNASQYLAISLGPANTMGQFTLRGIVPGEYKVFAWETMPNQAIPFNNPDFLARYESRGTTVIVPKGTAVAGVRVRLIPSGQ